jgi:hypothetical protein
MIKSPFQSNKFGTTIISRRNAHKCDVLCAGNTHAVKSKAEQDCAYSRHHRYCMHWCTEQRILGLAGMQMDTVNGKSF